MLKNNQNQERVYISQVELSCGLKMFLPPHTGVNSLVDEIIINDCYRANSLLEPNKIKPTIVVDVGAHAGLFSCFLGLSNPKLRIFAFEAHPTNYQFLQKNIRVNKLENQVTAYNMALAGYSGTCDLFSAFPPECHTIFMPKAEFYQDKLVPSGQVSCTCLDECLSFIKDGKYIDMIKIDCEGSEGEIFSCTSDETFSRIKRISMEYHEDMSILSSSELVNLFKSKGFETEKIREKKLLNRGMIYAYHNTN